MSLEHTLKTQSWSFRIFEFILSTMFVNAFFCFRYFDDKDCSFKTFLRSATSDMATISDPPSLISRTQPRVPHDAAHEAVPDELVHHNANPTHHLIPIKDSGKKTARCVICSRICYYYCEPCSSTQKKTIAVCGNRSGRKCSVHHMFATKPTPSSPSSRHFKPPTTTSSKTNTMSSNIRNSTKSSSQSSKSASHSKKKQKKT